MRRLWHAESASPVQQHSTHEPTERDTAYTTRDMTGTLPNHSTVCNWEQFCTPDIAAPSQFVTRLTRFDCEISLDTTAFGWRLQAFLGTTCPTPGPLDGVSQGLNPAFFFTPAITGLIYCTMERSVPVAISRDMVGDRAPLTGLVSPIPFLGPHAS
jgi:hypothetical protein